MSWLWRGFQSAVFYYVSCAPCTKFAYQRRRRKDRKRANVDREAEEGGYQHPSPFSTNVYWREEMLLGPGPPVKKKERDKEREKERENMHKSLGTSSSGLTGASSTDTTLGPEGREAEQERNSDEGWNRRRYQREDEILWGFDDNDRSSTPSARVSRAGTGSSAGHYYARNPEVNDLHPPIVNTPMDRNQTRWMLQPPPSARVMEGKERTNRSRSDSGRSGRSNASSQRNADMNLGRCVGEKLLEERLRRGEALSTDSLSPGGTSLRETSTLNIPGQRHDRERRLSNESRSTNNSQRKQPPPPITISADLRPPASRPALSTIVSQTQVEQAEARPSRPKLVPMDSTSSLHVLQELVSPLSLTSPPTAKLNSNKLNSLARSPSPLSEAAIKLPPANAGEDQELALPSQHSDGWAISQGTDGAVRELRQRWSMDL